MQIASKNNSIEGQYKYVEKITPREKLTAWLSRIVIWLVILIVLFPIVAIFSASVAEGTSFATSTSIFPKTFTMANYKSIFTSTNFGT